MFNYARLIFIVSAEWPTQDYSGSSFGRATNGWYIIICKKEIQRWSIPSSLQETRKIPDREWAWNIGKSSILLIYIVYSLIPTEFKAFVINEAQKSDKLYAEKRGEEIEVAPEIAKLFIESKTLSSNADYWDTYRKQGKIQPDFEVIKNGDRVLQGRRKESNKLWWSEETK